MTFRFSELLELITRLSVYTTLVTQIRGTSESSYTAAEQGTTTPDRDVQYS